MRRWVALALAIPACSSPPDPTIPPREEIGPPRPAATVLCFPPFSDFAQDRFVLADLDLGVSCPVFLEQDECILGIYDDCTDPSRSSRQWVGMIDSKEMTDRLEFAIHQGPGAVAARPPQCCSGELVDSTWALLRCTLTADCDNASDTAHVGAYLERVEDAPTPWGTVRSPVSVAPNETLVDLAYVSGAQQVWALARDQILVQRLDGGTATTLPVAVTDGTRLLLAKDENTAYVADGPNLLRIDTGSKDLIGTTDVGAPIDLLAYTTRGILVGVRDGQETVLTLRDTGVPESIIGMLTVDQLSAVVPVPEGTERSAFVAAEADGDLLVLTGTLAIDQEELIEKPARALFGLEAGIVGYFAECSELSAARHCYFEKNIFSTEPPRRIGIPDVGMLVDALPIEDRVLFAGTGSYLAVFDRREWRPLVQRRVPLEGAVKLARDRTTGEVFALEAAGGRVARISPN